MIANAERDFVSRQIQMLDHRDKCLMTADVALKLCKVFMYNCHAYRQNAGTSVASSNSLGETVKAVFLLASKVEHSCAPNVEININENGMLQYTTFTTLKQGDRILYSYGPGYAQPRQQALYESRIFLCQCKRCINFDECSPYEFPRCKKQTMFEGWDLSDSGSYRWKHTIALPVTTKLQKEISINKWIKSPALKKNLSASRRCCKGGNYLRQLLSACRP